MNDSTTAGRSATRILIDCLAARREGFVHQEWIAITNEEDMREAIAAHVDHSPGAHPSASPDGYRIVDAHGVPVAAARNCATLGELVRLASTARLPRRAPSSAKPS